MLSVPQRAHVRTVISAAKAHEHDRGEHGHAFKLAVLCLMTAGVEANWLNYASANVPASIKYRHQPVPWTSDGLGHDHASCGGYQQQTGYKWCPDGFGFTMTQTTLPSPDGWGTPEQLMTYRVATHLFIHALEASCPDWRTREDLGVMCQTVQGSAFPDRYQQQHLRAHRAVKVHYHLVRDPKRHDNKHHHHATKGGQQ